MSQSQELTAAGRDVRDAGARRSHLQETAAQDRPFEHFLSAMLPHLVRAIEESSAQAALFPNDARATAATDASTAAPTDANTAAAVDLAQNSASDACAPGYTPRSKEDLKRYLYDPFTHFSLQKGKRIRPALWLLGAYLFDKTLLEQGTERETLLRMCTACEHFQTAALIHDDIADRSMYRRGELCLYKTEGIGLALNVGDCALVYALRVIMQEKSLAPSVRHALIDEFCRMEQETIEGQALDLGWARDKRWDLELDDYLVMAQKKTAYYSCATPLVLGALCANAPKRAIAALRSFGKAAGLAFQLQDDYLNIFGDSKAQGKDFRSDILEGKRTYLSLYALRHLPQDKQQHLQALLDPATPRAQECSEAKARRTQEAAALIKLSGADVASRETAQKLLTQAKAALAPDLFTDDARALLDDLCRLFVERRG